MFSVNLFVAEHGYQQLGQTAFYIDKGDSGQPSYRHFELPLLHRESDLP